jgi:hypothetical protein
MATIGKNIPKNKTEFMASGKVEEDLKKDSVTQRARAFFL